MSLLHIFIDPQLAFTEGTWKKSIGPGGDAEVSPISAAFESCAARLRDIASDPESYWAFTYCPFPITGNDHDRTFHPSIQPFVADASGVFCKVRGYVAILTSQPQNDIFDAVGFSRWLESFLVKKNVRQIVVGGCTLNSCVRVSALALRRFVSRHVVVSVDLGLCGARASNYTPLCPDCFSAYKCMGPVFLMLARGGACGHGPAESRESPVGRAVREMREAGVVIEASQ